MDAGGWQEWRGQQGWIVLSVSLERRAHVVDLIVCAPSEMLERACVRAAPPEYQAEVELPFMSELPRELRCAAAWWRQRSDEDRAD